MGEPKRDIRWDYTDDAINYAKRIGKHEQVDGQDYYQGRRIIGRDTPINKGVYFTHGNEAVVVDDEKDLILQEIYQNVLAQIEEVKKQGRSYKKEILDIVYNTTLRSMPYDHGDKRAHEIHQRIGDNRKVALGQFIGAGVCRHQALLMGYLLEKLATNGYLRGQVSVDRNKDLANWEGHAWVRYTNSKGKVVILDAAQEFLGELDINDKKKWPYARPEDLLKLAQLQYDQLLEKDEHEQNITPVQRLIHKIKKLMSPYPKVNNH